MADTDAAWFTVTLEMIRVEAADDPAAFRAGVQEYMLRGDEGTHAVASLTWDEALLQSLADLRAPGCDPEVAQALGERLRRFLAAGKLAAIEDRIERALADGQRVRVEIVAGAAELAALPWELLTLGNRHLGELPGVEIHYRWPGGQATESARTPAQEGGRVLVAWSRGGEPLGEQYTLDAIDAAARAGGVAFDRARDVIADASLPAIVAAVEKAIASGDPPAILHILCHGAPIGSGYGLRLGDGRGGTTTIDSRTLRGALAPLAGYLRLVVLMACDSGNSGTLGTRLGSVAGELHRAGFAAVVASRYPVSGAAALAFTEQFYSHMFYETCAIEQAFRSARERLVKGGRGEWSTFQLHVHAGGATRAQVVRPYRGLLAFEREHAALFFGRDPELAENLGDLDALIAGGKPRLLAVVGASGTGKSSLVLSPVRVALERRGWRVGVIRPGAAPNDALAQAERVRPKDGPTLLIVDQLEELFTHCVDRGKLAEATAFVRSLWRLAADTAVIVTLRVDYLGRCGELSFDDAGTRLDSLLYDEAHRVFVAQMTREALRHVIEDPARRVGLSLETGLAERLIDEVAADSNALPLLEYVLDALWQQRRDDRLTHAALDAVGGVVGALEKHADAAVDALDAEAAEQARRILVRLTVFGADPQSGARRREDEASLRSRKNPGASERAVAALIAARLLVRREEPGAAASLEIAHEALIRRWARLWRWYEAERDRLGRARELARLLEQWQRYGPLSGKALALGQELVQGLDDDDVSPEARTMLAVSEARARRKLRTRRILLGGALTTLAVFALVVGALYLQADRSARRSQASQRVAAAGRFITSRPHLAAALLRSADEPDLIGWRQAAFSVLQTPQPAVVADPHDAEAGAAAFLPGGGLLVGYGDGALQEFPPAGPPAPVVKGERRISDLAVTPDGASLYVLRPPQLELWDRASMTRRAAVDVDEYGYRIFLGALTGEVLVNGGTRPTRWARAGDRLDARPAPASFIVADPVHERLLRAAGDNDVVVETWSGEHVSKYTHTNVGRASSSLAGVYDDPGEGPVTAWSWRDGGALVPRTIDEPYRGQGLLAVAALAERTVLHVKREAFGVEATVLCTQPLAETTADCVVLAPGCMLGRVDDRLARIDCADHVELRRVETLAVSATLAGPDAMRAAVFDDGQGQFALHAADRGELWRWRATPPPSGLTVIDRDWFTMAPMGYLRVPTLQAAHDRIIAALLEDAKLRLELWPLDPATIDRTPVGVTVDIPLVAGYETPREQLYSGDSLAVFIDNSQGPARILVGALEGQRFITRSVHVKNRDLYLTALARDGQHAYGLHNGAVVRVDLRGDEAREEVVAGAANARDLVLAPDGKHLALVGDELTILDLASGAALRPDADVDLTRLHSVAFAPDGVTVALGARSGAVRLARIRADGTLQRVNQLLGQRGSIEGLAFSADGKTLVSVDGARHLFVWTELESDRPASVSVEIPEPLWHIGLSSRGEQVWALSQLGELRFWSIHGDDAALRRELTARTTYCLSPREWTILADVPESAAEQAARDACPNEQVP